MLILILFIPFIIFTTLPERGNQSPQTERLWNINLLIVLPICVIVYFLAMVGCNKFYKSCDTVVTDKQTLPLCDSGGY